MTTSDDHFWKSKLAAFLHDPPHKPLRIAGHEDARKSFCMALGMDEEDLRTLFERPSDHMAAAADRMIFPDPQKSGVRMDWKQDADCAFHHSLSGEKLKPSSLPATASLTEEWLQKELLRSGSTDDDSFETRWWKTWRLWPENAARKHPLLAYLVADTRVPHHTLWHHNGLVSAINSCEGKQAFLLFQIGPVQDFIKQARTTRDLWAGSFLLSYLISRAMFAVAKQLGPDSIVYPQLRGVPLIDRFGYSGDGQFWSEPLRASSRDELLTPNLPNRFLALVPQGWQDGNGRSVAEVASAGVHAAWSDIAKAVHGSIIGKLAGKFSGWDMFWETRISRFPVIDHVIHDWQDTEATLADADKDAPPIRGGWDKHPLRDAIRWATERIPAEHRDSRCYPLNQGFVWALHYAAAEWKFAAVKNARAFPAWNSAAGVEKDHLDGRNEVLGGEDHQAFWAAMREIQWNDKSNATLFKGRQEYGAITTIKRLFPVVWMKDALGAEAPRFDSVQDIAEAIDSEEESNKYYAILCMDGDDMGQWVGGSRTPPWKDVLSGDGNDPKTPLGYFKQHWGSGWENVRTPLAPSFHVALSEALGNYSLYCAGQIVEKFHGQLIYAGGDDVLSMVPVDSAIDCADALQLVFRGIDPRKEGRSSTRVQSVLTELFKFPARGFVECRKGTGRGDHCRPNWPLMVPGPMSTASVGIAIGHVRSPMQDVIQAAREAETAAKEVEGKGALALRVLKRSGESVQFAARFDWGVLGLWAELDGCRAMLSSRFIHRYLRKLQPMLAAVRDGRATWIQKWENDGIDMKPILKAELLDSLRQQSSFSESECKERSESWTDKLFSLSPENFVHFWMARAFVNRLDDPNSHD
jgi:CRISPR-associated protein Cmr2